MRTIYLQEGLTGWQIIVSPGIGAAQVSGKHHANVADAIQTFIVEGRNQPSATLVVRMIGKKLVTIKTGGTASADATAEMELIAKIRAALKG